MTNEKAPSKVVELKNIEINKGKAVFAKLHHMDYDFVMALGDDHTDEDIPGNSKDVNGV